MHWQARLRETVIAEERLMVRLVMTKLEPRQETGHSRHLVIDRLGDSAKRLPEAGAGALAVAEPLATRRGLDVVGQVIHDIACRGNWNTPGFVGFGGSVNREFPFEVTAGTMETGAVSSAYRYSPMSWRPGIGVFQVATGSIAHRF